MHGKYVISVRDLRFVTILCRRCQTRPRSLSGRITRAATPLRSAGIDIIRHPRGRQIEIRKSGEFCVTTDSSI